MKRIIFTLGLSLALMGFFFIRGTVEESKSAKKPNIVIILSDDQGYADVSYHDHPEEVSTPAIDALAKSGMVFTNGYASAYVCAPTRAGLLTGRYQQRYGFYQAADSREGLPLTEILLPQLLKEKGYSTGVFGKWHIGLEHPYRPNQRGFDAFYGFLGHGAHDYFDLECDPSDAHQCIYRNHETINDQGYLTDNLAREANAFIRKNAKADQPFFLYLPFNAVHWPLQAPEEDIAKFNTGDKERDVLLAMLYRMDLAVGSVINTLKETGQYENTLVFYFSDNGGAAKNKSNNMPLRDYKQSTYEGGLRVPFIVSWPDRIKAGTSTDEPVISLDIMPTICATLGIDLPSDRVYDGKDMTSLLKGKKLKNPLHDQLFWDGDQGQWAVREGDWKLVYDKKRQLGLFNLKEDIGEANNRASEHPELTKKLEQRYKTWRGEMGEPMGRRN
ncbi:MAG: sulfatase-like hydrolase/transferase [Cyclobacteriaceae bacterium]|nr:sulfatase-like hydrolase/transferase [Cyclobacteriaceae bacterium]